MSFHVIASAGNHGHVHSSYSPVMGCLHLKIHVFPGSAGLIPQHFSAFLFCNLCSEAMALDFWLNQVMHSKIPSSLWVDCCADQHYSPLPECFWVDLDPEDKTRIKVEDQFSLPEKYN